MSVVKLRIEIERTLRDFMIDNGGTPERPAGITEMVSALQKRRVAPASTKPFLASLRVMLEASHGVDVDGTSAQRAIDVGTTFLAELRELRAHSGKDG